MTRNSFLEKNLKNNDNLLALKTLLGPPIGKAVFINLSNLPVINLKNPYSKENYERDYIVIPFRHSEATHLFGLSFSILRGQPLQLKMGNLCMEFNIRAQHDFILRAFKLDPKTHEKIFLFGFKQNTTFAPDYKKNREDNEYVIFSSLTPFMLSGIPLGFYTHDDQKKLCVIANRTKVIRNYLLMLSLGYPPDKTMEEKVWQVLKNEFSSNLLQNENERRPFLRFFNNSKRMLCDIVHSLRTLKQEIQKSSTPRPK